MKPTEVRHDSEGRKVTDDGRPFSELLDSGLLWLINATVFHPRGYAMTLHLSDGKVTGWGIVGDGSEPWVFVDTPEIHAKFRAAQATLP